MRWPRAGGAAAADTPTPPPGETRRSRDQKFAGLRGGVAYRDPLPLERDPYCSVGCVAGRRLLHGRRRRPLTRAPWRPSRADQGLNVTKSDFRPPDKRGVMAKKTNALPPRKFVASTEYSATFANYIAVRAARRVHRPLPRGQPPCGRPHAPRQRSCGRQDAMKLSSFTPDDAAAKFAEIDRDGSGYVDRSEIRDLLQRTLGSTPPTRYVDLLLQYFDANRVRARCQYRRACPPARSPRRRPGRQGLRGRVRGGPAQGGRPPAPRDPHQHHQAHRAGARARQPTAPAASSRGSQRVRGAGVDAALRAPRGRGRGGVQHCPARRGWAGRGPQATAGRGQRGDSGNDQGAALSRCRGRGASGAGQPVTPRSPQELEVGTAKHSCNPPGYGGFVPSVSTAPPPLPRPTYPPYRSPAARQDTRNERAIEHGRAERTRDTLRKVHIQATYRHNPPGYTGHVPSAPHNVNTQRKVGADPRGPALGLTPHASRLQASTETTSGAAFTDVLRMWEARKSAGQA